MKFIALTDLPQGQKPGDVFDVPEEVGDALVRFGAAKRVDESDKPKKGTYRRRDLVADETRDLKADA